MPGILPFIFRNTNQVEAGLIEETASGLILTEVKANRTYRDNLLANLHKIGEIAGLPVRKKLIFGGDEGFEMQDVRVSPWFEAS